MEKCLEKQVGFQKLPQEDIELLQDQKNEKFRLIKIYIIVALCLTIIGKAVTLKFWIKGQHYCFSGILTAIFYVDQTEISIEYMYGIVKPMNSSIVVESDMQPRLVFTFRSSPIRLSIQMVKLFQPVK